MRFIVSRHPLASKNSHRSKSSLCHYFLNFDLLANLWRTAMVFLSTTVVKYSLSRPLLPWQIIECHSGSITIRDFFETVLLPRLNIEESETIEVPSYLAKPAS